MRIELIISILFLALSCTEKPASHLADLKPSSTHPSEIILFDDEFKSGSSEPSQNIVPPHGKSEKERMTWFIEGDCIGVGNYQVCRNNDRLNSRLKMSVVSGSSRVEAKPIGGSLSDILSRFMGAPPASIQKIIKFTNESVGLVHSYGFSVIQNGKFCDPVAINPNSKMWFGTDAHGALLIYTSAPLTGADRVVDGWREYEMAKQCLTAQEIDR